VAVQGRLQEGVDAVIAGFAAVVRSTLQVAVEQPHRETQQIFAGGNIGNIALKIVTRPTN
jgi:hypothetical protein